MNKYIIIPGCSDLNRGDQALVWETKRIAEKAGYKGEYYLTSEKNEPVNQSMEFGLRIILPILEHPSRMFKNKNNINYTKILKIKWGIIASLDLVKSLMLLWSPTRTISKFFMSSEKRNSINTFEESSALFMKGGGLLQTYGGITSTYSMYFWLFPILLAHSLNVPVYILPNSFGPFKGPLVKSIARNALKKCRLVLARESMSKKAVKDELGFDVDCFPDLAFYLPKSKIDKESFLKKYDITLDKPVVAITMRPYRFPNSKNPEIAYKNFKDNMKQVIEWLYVNNFVPLIIEHTHAINAHENDGACISDVIKDIESKKYIVVSNSNYNCEDLKAIYGFADYIIGTRFHSVIFSFGSNVPGIAIAYTGNKAQGIMRDIGIEKYVKKIDSFESSDIIETFKEIVINYKKIQNSINLYREKSEIQKVELIDMLRRG